MTIREESENFSIEFPEYNITLTPNNFKLFTYETKIFNKYELSINYLNETYTGTINFKNIDNVSDLCKKLFTLINLFKDGIKLQKINTEESMFIFIMDFNIINFYKIYYLTKSNKNPALETLIENLSLDETLIESKNLTESKNLIKSKTLIELETLIKNKNLIEKETLIERNKIIELLKFDATQRYTGINNDLFTPYFKKKEYKFSFPTLLNEKYIRFPSNIYENEIINYFYSTYPFMKNTDKTNLLIAGGSICNSILQLKDEKSDIDIFIYGLNKNEANKKVFTFLRNIYNNENLCDFTFVKSTRSATILFNIKKDSPMFYLKNFKFKLQIIFRLYKTKSEILHGFDLGSSAVGFDGSNVYFTSLSKFCYTHMCNIIDLTRRSTTYENRLVKYNKKGFAIIFPNLNLPNIIETYKNSFHNLVKMNYLGFYVSFNNKNLLVGAPYAMDTEKTTAPVKHDYDSIEDCGKTLDDLFNVKESFVNYIKEKLNNNVNKPKSLNFDLYDSFDINWIIDDVGSQLKLSINPIIEKPIEWYGKIFYLNENDNEDNEDEDNKDDEDEDNDNNI